MSVKLMQSEGAAQLGLFKFSPCLSLRSIKYERRRPKCFREVLTTRAIALIYLYTKFECCLEFEKYQHECWFISKFGKYQKKMLFLSQILVVCLKHREELFSNRNEHFRDLPNNSIKTIVMTMKTKCISVIVYV